MLLLGQGDFLSPVRKSVPLAATNEKHLGGQSCLVYPGVALIPLLPSLPLPL